MDENELNEQRASLYWWFATLLTKELDKEKLAHYFSGEGVALLTQLGTEPKFEQAVAQIKAALVTIMAIKQPSLELAADFSQLFLTDAKKGAPPYASVYLSETGQLFEKPHHEMLDIFKQQGLMIDPDFKEPADHIAIQLDYLGNLIMKEDENSQQAQTDFIEHQLLSWLSTFVSATQKVNNSGFYQGICQLLLLFVEQDLNELNA
ncbi:molecular chaperone TorD [Psychromonas sp. Urea-02u-13]|uniref:molecular chaperone TorD n=1 Tax=Psychromonas sp. Urea-02u-13 TaxID=2058326 RepID=UPI000C330292|nr:molecular chaperone TorD [Psychromonas sp. Urea-02u-13]PKG38548.1 molecular chaperone TorD [Psychromonas sp. Urea-02u-13]